MQGLFVLWFIIILHILFVVGGTVMGFVGSNEVFSTGYMWWCIAHCSLSMEYAPQMMGLPTVMVGYLNGLVFPLDLIREWCLVVGVHLVKNAMVVIT